MQNTKNKVQRPWWLKGQALVEFSLILPTLLFLLLGIIDYGRILLVYSNASSSIRDAARLATIFSNDASGTPYYVSCASIDAAARNLLFADIQSVNILYYSTRSLDPTNSAAYQAAATAIEQAITNPENAFRDCNGNNAIGDPAQVSENDVYTGDLMVVTMQARIEFITPILANIFPTLELDFRAQRTIIATLELSLLGTDREPDGLDDRWEYNYFGCLLDGWDEEPKLPLDPPLVAIRPTNPGVLIIIPISGTIGNVIQKPWDPTSGTTPIGSSSNDPADWETASFPADCATEELDPANYDPANGSPYPAGCTLVNVNGDDVLQGCYVPNTQEFSATGDPDFDGCNNGCEEIRGTNPIDGLPGSNAQDTDGDGLLDGQEAGGFQHTMTINGATTTVFIITDPLVPDTDGDGLSDGDEVNLYITNPLLEDTDGDGLEDGAEVNFHGTDPTKADTDGDGLNDKTEIDGLALNLTIDGATRNISVKTNANNPDSDGDGLTDNEEYQGNGAASPYKLNPMSNDTDGDGLLDGDEFTNSTNPTLSDTDGDRLKDGEEVNTYSSDPNNVDTDGDNAGCAYAGPTDLNDYNEVKGFNIVERSGTADADGDGTYNLNETDSDGDTISDCDEFYYGTNPYNADTDGGGLADNIEISPEYSACHEATQTSSDDSDPACTGGGLDSEPDGNTDDWEIKWFTDITSYAGTDDPDNDNCNNICEEARATNPQNPDTDNDGLRDGDEVGTLPLNPDTDGDNLPDGSKAGARGEKDGYDGTVGWGTNPTEQDTDGDTLSDYDEVTFHGTNPLLKDTDGDNLFDGQEVNGVAFSSTINSLSVNYTLTTNPLVADTDGDGLGDYNEIFSYGTYPSDPDGAGPIDPTDSDGDGLKDASSGTVFPNIGERNNEFNVSFVGYGSDPRNADTDGDGLADYVEAQGITGYVISIDGVPQAPIDLPGFDINNQISTTNLSIFSADTDGDLLSDGDEINIYGTNPLLANTDGDAYVLDGTDPDPLTPEQADTDGDSIFDDVETAANPPTDPAKFDSDGDRMGDGDELVSLNIPFTCYGSCSPASPYSENNVQLDTTFQVNGNRTLPTGSQYGDGYDSDGDGLSDVFELFWYQSTATITALHPEFSSFLNNGFETCAYLAANLPPVGSRYSLHPDRADTDQDGLRDGDECNVYNTNPFSGSAEGPLFAKVVGSSFLNGIVYPSLAGDLDTASVTARSLNFDLGADGRIEVLIRRADAPAPPANKYQLLGSLITGACGPSAYTDALGNTTTFNNVCGVFSGGSEANSNVQNVLVRIPLSQFFTILKDSRVVTMTPQ